MPGYDSVLIIGRVTLDGKGLNVKSRMSQLARARRALSMSWTNPPGHLSSRRMALSVSTFQDAEGMEPEAEEAVEQPIFPGSETYIDPKEELRV